MIVITLQRDKCIGCAFCKEHAGEHFTMSQKDGRAILLHSTEKKKFFTTKINHTENLHGLIKAKENCPVKIIQITET